MAIINACQVPPELYYDVVRSIWIRLEADGLVTTGMTDPFQTRAGKLLHIHPRPVGRVLIRGKAAATIESAKFVGPLPMLLSGEILEHNPAVMKSPLTVNKDPYGAGWVVRYRPANLFGELDDLLTGDAAIEAFRAKLTQDKVHCIRCAD